MELKRQFHSAARLLFKQKNTATNKTRVPRKNAGEYRDFRHASAYSNMQKSAPEVPVGSGLELISADTISSGKLPVGKVGVFSDVVQSSMTHLGSFRPQQRHELFRTHGFLVRENTAQLATNLKKGNYRAIIDGAPGCGKSTLLAQSHGLAKTSGWSVMHIPQALSLLDGSTDAVYNSEKNVWSQPMLLKRWAKRIAKANRDSLPADTIKALKAGSFTSAKQLFDTISSQSEHGVLVTIDDLTAFAYQPFSRNVDTDCKRIYHGDMEIPQLILQLLSGEQSLGKGAIIAAMTGVIQNPLSKKENDHPYSSVEEYDGQLAAKLAKASTVEVPRFTIAETQAYLEYLEAAGVASQKPRSVSEVYAVAGNGNPRSILDSFVNFSF